MAGGGNSYRRPRPSFCLLPQRGFLCNVPATVPGAAPPDDPAPDAIESLLSASVGGSSCRAHALLRRGFSLGGFTVSGVGDQHISVPEGIQRTHVPQTGATLDFGRIARQGAAGVKAGNRLPGFVQRGSPGAGDVVTTGTASPWTFGAF